MTHETGALDSALRRRWSGSLVRNEHVIVSDGYPKRVPPLENEQSFVYFDSGTVVVGPIESPGKAGCLQCLLNRRLLARPHSAQWTQLFESDSVPRLDEEIIRSRPGLVALVSACLADLFTSPSQAGGARFFTVRVHDGVVTSRRLEPDPLCTRCGALPPDEPWDFPSGPITKADRRDLRVGNIDLDVLLTRYVDDYAGVIPRVELGEEAGLQVARAQVGIRNSVMVEAGWGRSTTAQGAKATAVLEALERWCGLAPGRNSAAGTWSFDQIRGMALDVRTTGTPFAQGYGTRITPFSESAECRWTWAKSVTDTRDVLVPEGFAYYGSALVHPGDPRFAYEISNGCALGGSLTEAALFGALEVVERDALLLAWYSRSELDRLNLASASPSNQKLWKHLETTNNCRIVAWDLASPIGIPAVWVMAIRDDLSLRAPAKCVSASSCRPTYDGALNSALCELGPIMASVDASFPKNRDRVGLMLEDSTQVKDMGDHALLYAHPDAFVRFGHLDTSADADEYEIPARDAAAGLPLHLDLSLDFKEVLARLELAGLPTVLIVDQTAVELEQSGLHCAKVIIPGTLPMTFGHDNRRLTGLHRLDSVLAGRGASIEPHPFP